MPERTGIACVEVKYTRLRVKREPQQCGAVAHSSIDHGFHHSERVGHGHSLRRHRACLPPQFGQTVAVGTRVQLGEMYFQRVNSRQTADGSILYLYRRHIVGRGERQTRHGEICDTSAGLEVNTDRRGKGQERTEEWSEVGRGYLASGESGDSECMLCDSCRKVAPSLIP